MRSGEVMCQVCAQESVFSIYQHHIRFLDVITPPRGVPIKLPLSQTQFFKISADQPAHGLTWDWSVNGQPNPNFHSKDFLFSGLTPGIYHVELNVSDKGPFINPTMAAARHDVNLSDRAGWDITVPAAAQATCIDTNPATAESTVT